MSTTSPDTTCLWLKKEIVASAWNGYGNEYGTVTTHSWNDGAEDDEAEPEMGSGVNYKLECNPRRYRTRAAMAERRQRA